MRARTRHFCRGVGYQPNSGARDRSITFPASNRELTGVSLLGLAAFEQMLRHADIAPRAARAAGDVMQIDPCSHDCVVRKDSQQPSHAQSNGASVK